MRVEGGGDGRCAIIILNNSPSYSHMAKRKKTARSVVYKKKKKKKNEFLINSEYNKSVYSFLNTRETTAHNCAHH
jgi:hypothetical protein